MYYNYHAKAKKLISEGHLVKSEIVEKWNAISPALVLYFDNHELPSPTTSEMVSTIPCGIVRHVHSAATPSGKTLRHTLNVI